MYHFSKYQMAIILFNSNIILKVQETEVFKKWITIRESFPSEGEPHKVISYYRIGDSCSDFFMKSGEDIYLEIEGVWRDGVKYQILNGSLEDAIAYANDIIYNSVRGANLHYLDVLVDLFDNYIPIGATSSWFNDAEDCFLTGKEDGRVKRDAFSANIEVTLLEKRFGEDLVEFIASLYHQPFGEHILRFNEDEGEDLVYLRYITEDGRCISNCNCWNAWQEIRYLKFPTELKIIIPWESSKDQFLRVIEMKEFFNSLNNEEHQWLININEKFRKWIKERCLKEVNCYRI